MSLKLSNGLCQIKLIGNQVNTVWKWRKFVSFLSQCKHKKKLKTKFSTLKKFAKNLKIFSWNNNRNAILKNDFCDWLSTVVATCLRVSFMTSLMFTLYPVSPTRSKNCLWVLQATWNPKNWPSSRRISKMLKSAKWQRRSCGFHNYQLLGITSLSQLSSVCSSKLRSV